jgi:hypothetical protein
VVVEKNVGIPKRFFDNLYIPLAMRVLSLKISKKSNIIDPYLLKQDSVLLFVRLYRFQPTEI